MSNRVFTRSSGCLLLKETLQWPDRVVRAGPLNHSPIHKFSDSFPEQNNCVCAVSETIRDTCSSSRDSWTLTAPSVLSGNGNQLRNLCRILSGTVAMGLFSVAQPFFGGDTILKQHGKSRVGLLTTSEWARGRALTLMTVDQQRDGLSMPLPAVDWELYRRLKAEGRVNLLFHFWEAAAAGVQYGEAPTSRSNLLPFVSRAEHLAWRARWKNGRWVKLSWTPEQRDAIIRQDEEYRLADIRWAERHGPVAGGAIIALFPLT
jgi:hypothetical protein